MSLALILTGTLAMTSCSEMLLRVSCCRLQSLCCLIDALHVPQHYIFASLCEPHSEDKVHETHAKKMLDTARHALSTDYLFIVSLILTFSFLLQLLELLLKCLWKY